MTRRRLSLSDRIARAAAEMDPEEIKEIRAMPVEVLEATIVCATWIVEAWIPRAKLDDAHYQRVRRAYDPQGERRPAFAREFNEAVFPHDELELRVGRRRRLAVLLLEERRFGSENNERAADAAGGVV